LPFSEGLFYAWTEKPYSETEINILNRFKAIIDLTFRRYFDLQKAEAQARESQIEAALERVRSKAMAMQKSEDLAEAVAIVFEELDKLKLGMLRCGIGIINKEKRSVDFWSISISKHGSALEISGDESMDTHPLLQGAFDAWLGQGDFSYILQGDDLIKYYKSLPESQSVLLPSESVIQFYYVATFQAGGLFAFRETSFPDEAKTVMKRFADVFNLTYTRFNDLKQAEQQTHKAQIEVALERVRARALAMHEPEELIEVAQVLRHEMGLLGVEELETGTIFTHDESSDKVECWFAIKDTSQVEKRLVSDHITIDLNQTWVGREMRQFYGSDKKQISVLMRGPERREWIEYCYSLSSKLKGFYGDNIPDRTYHLYKSSDGVIGAASPGDLSEESWDLLKRAALVFSLAYSRFKDLTKARLDLKQLKEEKKRSESLLLNILPEEIANELKQFGKSYARKHEQVSILFADIKGFSSIAEDLSADDLVTQLDECFRAFDNIIDKHGMEKIKTIGDAYICASGLPRPVPDNAIKTVKAALDMLDFIKGFGLTKKIQNLPVFEFRVGIHTGPVITGVVGLKKFTYDIWGDAVNMAARMEQHGEAGRINISGNTYRLVKDKFTCTHRGKIEAKNKGELDMYFVESEI
ncbi:MAG: adenylate/guanylate cyclase domain-containing protein, partial [Bacteroidota bacterium]|nr:adenylate/guanylate cyclase domain-containing protein [Bacteroidota bacterium]